MNKELLKNRLKEAILEKGIPLKSAGINSFGFYRSDALEIITLLEELGISILGGDVYQVLDSKIIPTYDNWSTAVDDGSINMPKNLASQSRQFIVSYHETDNYNYIYILVTDSTELEIL